MTEHVRRFAERAADVPVQLRRRLAIIRSLDEQIANTQKEVEEKIRRSILDKGRGGGGGGGAKRQKVQHAEQRSPQGSLDIHGAVQRISNLAEEKVNIASQIYAFIDRHINHLDTDLAELDAEIEAERKELGLQPEETACGKLGLKVAEDDKAGSVPPPAKGARSRKKASATAVAASAAAAAGPSTSLAANEPLYCICQRPSAGEMVGCDMEDCMIEWFHVECLGLDKAPAGEVWNCPVCTGSMALPAALQRAGKA